jgi:hypothetical protein
MPQEQDRPATHDFYANIHKALRLSLSRLLVRLGNTDPDDEAALCALCADLRSQMVLSLSHLQHEEAVIHAALARTAPDVVGELEEAHGHHRTAFELIAQLALEVRLEPVGGRDRAMRSLYLAFSRFVAEDFAHMAEEELNVLPLLQALFSDAELMAMEAEIIASIGPDEMLQTARLMMPALRPAERLAMARHARATTPTEVFDGLMAGVLPALEPKDAERLLCELSVVLPLAHAA